MRRLGVALGLLFLAGGVLAGTTLRAQSQGPLATAPAMTQRAIAPAATTPAPARVVYLVDHSGSLLDNFYFLQRQMKRTIYSLAQDQMFSVAVFAGTEEGTEFLTSGKALVRATAVEKRAAITNLDRVMAKGKNDDELNPFLDAFQKAFAMKPDVICFVTDGRFDPNLIAKVKGLNTGKTKVRVDTIAFMGKDDGYFDQMRQMAKDSGGVFSFVSSGEAEGMRGWWADAALPQAGAGTQALFGLLDSATGIWMEIPPRKATAEQLKNLQDKKAQKIDALVTKAKGQWAGAVNFSVSEVRPGATPGCFEVRGEVWEDGISLALTTQDAAAGGWKPGQQVQMVLPNPVDITWSGTATTNVKITITAGKAN